MSSAHPSNVVPIRPTRVPQLRFSSRGPVSALVLEIVYSPVDDATSMLDQLQHIVDDAVDAGGEIEHDDDLQLTLLILHCLHYGGLVEPVDDWEWNPGLIAARQRLERAFERRLRDLVTLPELPKPDAEAVASALFAMTGQDSGPSLSRFAAKQATDEQMTEFVVQKSIYTLKEADAHTWAIPRLTGTSKAAMVEVQSDEYGGGRADRMHAQIFARTMRGLGLDDTYGAYLDNVPAVIIASFTMMTMFGLNGRLRGASAGHLAAYEMTSSIPCGLIARGFRRLGYGDEVTWYYDEHVEADAVHEQIAGRDLAGSLAEEHPELLEDILFGAGACLTIDGMGSAYMLDAWMDGRSSLRMPLAAGGVRR